MPYVVTPRCEDSRDGSCIDVCPVDAIHPTDDEPGHNDEPQVYIDPITCIECGACVPACPVGAIFIHTDVPSEYHYAQLRNASFFESGVSGISDFGSFSSAGSIG